MLAYILRRLLLMIPTILGIMAVSFAIVQFVPGARSSGRSRGCRARPRVRPRNLAEAAARSALGAHRPGVTSVALPWLAGPRSKFIKELEKQYGFDKPALERFWILVRDYSTFNFGKSYYRDVPVLQLIKEKLPVSMSLGLWMTVLSYAISIPLGVRKAVKEAPVLTRSRPRLSSLATQFRAFCSRSCSSCCSAADRSGRSFRCAA